MKRLARPWVVTVFLFLAFAAVRGQLVADLGVEPSQWVFTRLHAGLLHDLALTCFLLSGAWLTVSAGRTAPPVFWTLIVPTAWVTTVAGYAYFKFFKSPFSVDVLRYHWSDFFLVKDVGGGLALAPGVLVGAASLLVAVALTLGGRAFPAGRVRAGLHALALLVVGLLLRQSPVWINHLPGGATILSHQTVLRLFDVDSVNPKDNAWVRGNGSAERMPADEVRATLARYRDLGRNEPGDAAPDNPLRRSIKPAPLESAAYRRALGLPETGPVHVVLLFLEGFRSHELLHPVVGPKLFPELKAVLDRHALLFSHGYSSAMSAGSTVRGQFATLCSMINNLGGAAVYVAHPDLRIRCIQDVLGEQGYELAWLNPYRRSFHNKQGFELRHGMKRFFDIEYFRALGYQEEHAWGLRDGTFLQASIPVLEELAAQGKPVFAHLTTTGTHTPFVVADDGPVPEELRSGGGYDGLLSRFSAAGRATATFARDLFESKLGDRVLLVVQADHGVTLAPAGDLLGPRPGPVRMHEILARIPIALLTRHQPHPGIRTYPVHQVDVVPTIVDVLGTGARDVTWVGRNILDGSGSSWLFGQGEELSYRVGHRACWHQTTSHQPRCVDIQDGDPLLDDTALHVVEEDPAQRAFIERVMKAARSAIEHDQLF